MADLDKVIKSLTFIKENITQIATDALRMSSEFAIKTQQSQMLLGLNSTGKKIGSYKSKSYAQMKQQKNPSAGGSVDLYLEGNFSKGIYLYINSDSCLAFCFSNFFKKFNILNLHAIDAQAA